MAEASVEGLRDVFRCFICMERLQEARLCPHCSKFCCFPCIRTYRNVYVCLKIPESLKDLPFLLLSHFFLVNKRCTVHHEKLTVFCWTCQSCICHHCALWGGNHSGHTLKPLEDEYNQRTTQVNEEVTKLRRRLCLLINTLQELEKNMETIRVVKEDRARELRCAVELMIARLDSHMKGKLISLGSQKRSLSMEVEMVEEILSEVENQLATASQAQLVTESTELFRMLSQVQRSDPPAALFVPADFESEIVPPFDSQIFVLQPFSRLRSKADPIYSPGLQSNGLTWRLKVYPDGNGVVRGNYLSVFLELSHGPPEQAKYEYRVEMIHQASRSASRNVVREFASDFEVGECWGYNRFYKITHLNSEEFLDSEDDSLVLQFQVRPPSFYQKCKDLQWYIEEIQSSQARSESQINQIKEQLAIEISRNGTSTSAPGALTQPPTGENILGTSGSNSNPVPNSATQSDVGNVMPTNFLLSHVEVVPSDSNEEVEAVMNGRSTPDVHTAEEQDDFGTNLIQFLERDVEEQRRQSTENDVEEELVTSGGIREALDSMDLNIPDRENIDLLQDWPPNRATGSSERNVHSAESQGSTMTGRLQGALRSLEEAESESELSGWSVPVNSAEGRRHLDCPACSPLRPRKPIYRKIRSRHHNVLREEGFLVRPSRAVEDVFDSEDLPGSSTSEESQHRVETTVQLGSSRQPQHGVKSRGNSGGCESSVSAACNEECHNDSSDS